MFVAAWQDLDFVLVGEVLVTDFALVVLESHVGGELDAGDLGDLVLLLLTGSAATADAAHNQHDDRAEGQQEQQEQGLYFG